MGKQGDRPLRWHKIPRGELPLSRINLITLFAPSPDPYLVAQCTIPAEPLLRAVDRARERSGRPITLTTAVIKLLAAAIDRHPEFNCVVLGGDVYQLEDIAFTVPYLIPGDARELTNLIVEDPHRKSLDRIHDECEALRRAASVADAGATRGRATWLPAFLIRSGLYRLVGEKRAFRILYRRGLSTNLVLTNASHRGAGRFLITKSAAQILRAFTRFYLHGAEARPVVEGDRIVARKVIPLSIALDHRLIDGIHLNEFLKTIEELATAGLDSDSDDR